MTTALRWLHLSDFHVGKDNYAQHRLFGEIIAHVEAQKATGIVPDLVFITGDVANKGQKREYEEFRNSFYRPLCETLPDAKVFAVPGNHDVQRPSPDGLNPAALLKSGGRFFDPTREGRTARGQVTPRFKAYKQQMSLDVSADWITSDAGAYAETIVLADMTIGVVGINTAWLAMGDHDKEHITPGCNLVEEALKSVSNSAVRVVLGHHPLDWLDEGESERLRAIFGRHRVIYLHGHLHKADGLREEGAGSDFLVFQAGAGFQARDDEPWRNGLLWGEIDSTNVRNPQVRLCPRFWNPKNLDWPPETGRFPEKQRVPGSDWWAWSLPRSTEEATKASASSAEPWQAPEGWAHLDLQMLNAQRRDISIDEASRFFDGAEPDWALALCERIPRRSIVSVLAERIAKQPAPERTQVHLLIGPGGEGKSIALRQTVVDVANGVAPLAILWHSDASAPISAAQLLALPAEFGRWIVVSDAADLVIKQLHEGATALARAGRTDVQFLLATREVDWRAAGGQRYNWRPTVDFHQEVMSGLSEPDAVAIAEAWLNFEGHNNFALDFVDKFELGKSLFQAAKTGAVPGEGALLGGALTLRLGEGLREHIKLMMSRLAAIPLPGHGNLEQAFRYIAAMHAEGLQFLSRPVLAEAVGCSSTNVQKFIVFPLGREAAAGGGTLLLTRHRRIAQAAIAVLREDLGEDTDSLYVELATAAKTAFRRGYVPDLHRWDYTLPDHFLKSQPDLAYRIGHALVDSDPSNANLVVNLARLYRESGSPSIGAATLEGFTYDPGENRGFWSEWATCAGKTRNHALNAWLAGQALADITGIAPPAKDSAKKILAELCVAFSDLFRVTGEPIYNLARAGAALLGLTLDVDEQSKALHLRPHWATAEDAGAVLVSSTGALASVRNGLQSAWTACAQRTTLQARIRRPDQMTFTGLNLLVQGRRPAIQPPR